jgi:hypothetical protein
MQRLLSTAFSFEHCRSTISEPSQATTPSSLPCAAPTDVAGNLSRNGLSSETIHKAKASRPNTASCFDSLSPLRSQGRIGLHGLHTPGAIQRYPIGRCRFGIDRSRTSRSHGYLREHSPFHWDGSTWYIKRTAHDMRLLPEAYHTMSPLFRTSLPRASAQTLSAFQSFCISKAFSAILKASSERCFHICVETVPTPPSSSELISDHVRALEASMICQAKPDRQIR